VVHAIAGRTRLVCPRDAAAWGHRGRDHSRGRQTVVHAKAGRTRLVCPRDAAAWGHRGQGHPADRRSAGRDPVAVSRVCHLPSAVAWEHPTSAPVCRDRAVRRLPACVVTARRDQRPGHREVDHRSVVRRRGRAAVREASERLRGHARRHAAGRQGPCPARAGPAGFHHLLAPAVEPGDRREAGPALAAGAPAGPADRAWRRSPPRPAAICHISIVE